jgi:hypothetical protein
MKPGHDYVIASIEDGHAENIDRMASKDPTVAATARLARDLVNCIDAWLNDNGHNTRFCDEPVLMIAAMHGVTTVCGSILVNVHPSKQAQTASVMRKHLNTLFDSMVGAVERDAG